LSSRMTARATLGKGVRFAPFRFCVRRVPSLTMAHVSAKPSSHPGQSDFPNPVGGSSCFPCRTFLYRPKIKHSYAYFPKQQSYIYSSISNNGLHLYQFRVWSCILSIPTTHREPLCPSEVLPPLGQRPALSQLALPNLLSSYWLMRQTKSLQTSRFYSCMPGLCRLLRVPAVRWSFPTLSLQSLYRCLDPYPAVSSECIYPLLPQKY